MKARTLRFSWSIVVGAVAVIVSMDLLRDAALAQEAPFLSMGSATFVGVDPPYEFAGVTGQATQIGTFQGLRTVRLYGHTIVVTTTLAGRGGDSIDFYSELKWDKRFVRASGFYVITGGTGIQGRDRVWGRVHWLF